MPGGFASAQGTGHGFSPGQGDEVASATSPATIASGLKGWWDTSVISTLWQDSARTTPVAANSDPVGAIDDRSGNSKNLLQATAGFRPLYKTGIQNSLAAVLFDGTDDAMATAAISQVTTVATLFAVTKKVAGTTGKFFNNGVGNGYGFNIHGTVRDFLAEGVANQDDGNTTNNIEIWTGRISSVPAWVLRINGAGQVVTPSNSVVSTPATATYIGGVASNFFNGYLMEWGLYDSDIGATAVTTLETYLNAKWAAF